MKKAAPQSDHKGKQAKRTRRQETMTCKWRLYIAQRWSAGKAQPTGVSVISSCVPCAFSYCLHSKSLQHLAVILKRYPEATMTAPPVFRILLAKIPQTDRLPRRPLHNPTLWLCGVLRLPTAPLVHSRRDPWRSTQAIQRRDSAFRCLLTRRPSPRFEIQRIWTIPHI